MAIASAKEPKGVAVAAPLGGISAQLGEKSYGLVLSNGVIERFELHCDVSIFVLMDQILKNTAKISHCRDLVALGLVGGGCADVQADRIVSELPPNANFALRGVARDLLFAAFTNDEPKKKDEPDGSKDKAKSLKNTTPSDT